MNTLKKISFLLVAILMMASCSKIAPLGLDSDGKGDSIPVTKSNKSDIIDGDDDGDGPGIVDGDDDGDDGLDPNDKPNGGIIDGDDDGDDGGDDTTKPGGIIDGDDDGDDSIDNNSGSGDRGGNGNTAGKG